MSPRHHNNSHQVSQAFISQMLPTTSNAIPVIADSTVPYNTVSTTDKSTFCFDVETGVLTLKRDGNYTIDYNSIIRNVGTAQALVGLSVLLNGVSVPASQTFFVKNPNEFGVFDKTVNFDANCGDQVVILFSFSASSFQIPSSPLNLGFPPNSPISSTNWSPNCYRIIYNGLPQDDCGCNQ